jgi:cAMP-binding proteins - catabolite gene activator and regulatory subunit of cAMP-dependent protein kinases
MLVNYYDVLIRHLESLTNLKISEEEKRIIMNIFNPRKLKKKELFLKAGDVPDCIAFNISGLLRCYYIDHKGNDVTKYFCFENSVISYLGLILRKKSSYYIEAIEDSILLCANYHYFEKLTKNSNFGLKIINILLEQSLIYKEERESSFLLETATERYVHFITAYPNIEERINLGYIASYLGISQVSLSRIRNNLNKI